MNHLTVCSYLIMNYFSEIPTFIKDVIEERIKNSEKPLNDQEDFDEKNIYFFAEYIGIFFFALIFNEVIELDFFNLNKNTKASIEKRSIDEVGEEFSRNNSLITQTII